jgi:hypothetical protein
MFDTDIQLLLGFGGEGGGYFGLDFLFFLATVL